MEIEQKVESFFSSKFPIEKPLLLGFSGGEDSLVLATLLHQFEIPFHLAHFNHRWRPECIEQVLQLGEWAMQRGIPFHTEESRNPKKEELWARKERYAFFEKLFSTWEFTALILAHHQKDQAETVLKRIFEGAHLPALKGMSTTSHLGNLPVWRPLIHVSKEEIRDYVESYGLSPIEDGTNRDRKYLRARMRGELFPYLVTHFGKEIEAPLARLGEEAGELDAYFAKKTAPLLESRVDGPFGTMWDFNPFLPLDPLEVRYALRQMFSEQGVGRPLLNQLTSWLLSGEANRRHPFIKGEILVDRSHLFHLRSPLPEFPGESELERGAFTSEGWEWEIEWTEAKGEERPHWQDWWKGKSSLTLPHGKYTLAPPTGFFRKTWNGKKVPSFLRYSPPCILFEGKPIGEFLTGRNGGKKKSPLFQATISVKRENVVS